MGAYVHIITELEYGLEQWNRLWAGLWNLCKADGTVSQCSNFFCPFPDLKRVSFNTGRVVSYIQKAFVKAY